MAGASLIWAGSSFAQLHDEKSVTVTMDLQPILQLDMETSDQIEFVFDDIRDYYAGITQYSATILKVSSTVTWDLYAVGRSNGTTGAEFWDQVIDYGGGSGTNAVNELPLSLLELHQSQANPSSGGDDYNAAFSAAGTVSAANSLYVNGGGTTPPAATDKYIAGHKGTTGDGTDGVQGGSYLTQSGTSSDYYYVIDYRILPGLPAIFPNAHDADGLTAEDIVTVAASVGGNEYAEPGVYTMYVQYILLEDQ